MWADTTFIVTSILSAAFAVAYFPLFTRLSHGIVSPYAKADITKRAGAAMVDGLLVVSCIILYRSQDVVLFLVLAAAYLLLRDAIFVPGQSIGKFLFGLVVISLANGRPCTRVASAQRNFVLLIPGFNVIAAGLEAVSVARDPQGQRLGDKLANTQVVDGLGARELAKMFQRAMLDIRLTREEEPVEVK